jgi:hypothetical protein
VLIAAGWAIVGLGYLAVSLGYLVYGAVVAAGWVLFAAGWLIWHIFRIVYRVLDWTVDKCAPPIAARWRQWRDSTEVPAPPTAERRAPVKEPGVVHWGYGHLNLARTAVRELPAAPLRKSCAVVRRSRRVPAGPGRRSLRG